MTAAGPSRAGGAKPSGSAADRSAWVPDARRGRGGDGVPLFLLPPASGSAALFQAWTDAFPAAVRPLPVELPGHGRRMGQPPPVDLAELVQELDAACRPPAGRPWAVLGHSMGALAAALWAARANDAGQPPLVVYLSAAVPPWLLATAETLPAADDDALWLYMTGLGGVPPSLAEQPAARRLLLRIMRADVTAAASWRPAGPVSFGCPVVALTGRDDRAFPHDLVGGWRAASAGGFRAVVLPGGHFYTDGLADVLPAVREDLMQRIVGTTASSRQGRTHGKAVR